MQGENIYTYKKAIFEPTFLLNNNHYFDFGHNYFIKYLLYSFILNINSCEIVLKYSTFKYYNIIVFCLVLIRFETKFS